jgi:hypothetical protein
MVPLRIAVRKSPSRSVTEPLGSMRALIPDTAAFRTHRPVSMARI